MIKDVIKMDVIHLNSENLSLRKLLVSDISNSYISWMNDQEVNRFLESRYISHDYQTINKYVESFDGREDKLLCGMFLKDTKEHIGNISFSEINRQHSFGVIGICLGEKKLWGKGYGLEALKLFVDFGFNKLKLHRLEAGAYGNNTASIKIFQKAGFTIEGRLQNRFRFNNEFVDDVLLGFVNPNYKS